MPTNMIEKIREEDRKKRAQGYPGRIGDIRFTNEGSVRLPSGLRLSGEGPLFLPTLNLNLQICTDIPGPDIRKDAGRIILEGLGAVIMTS